MKRRRFIIAVPVVALAGGVGLALSRLELFERLFEGPPTDALQDYFAQRLPPTLLESAPGTLSDEDKALIWRLANTMGHHWGMSSLQRDDLFAVLDLKTGQPPSYLAEYQNALRLLREVPEDGWPRLPSLFSSTPLPADAAWYSPTQHVRRYVFEELLNLHLVRGGIERFGLTNGRGFIAGTFRYRKASAPWVTSQ